MTQRAEGKVYGRRFLLFFLALGLMVSAGGAIWLARTAAFVAQAVHAPGKIVAVESGKGSRGGTLYYPVFRFRDQAGQEHTRRAALGTGNYAFTVGEPVGIIYSPAAPEDAQIKRFDTLWLLPLAITAFGLLFSSFAALCLFLWRDVRSAKE